MSNYVYEIEISSGPYHQVSVKRLDELGNSHRYVLWPDADISTEPEDVRKVCQSAWTQEVADAWQQKLSNDLLEATQAFPILSRPAFLFMAEKLEMTEPVVLALIQKMPNTTDEEKDAKSLAEYVYKNQHAFERGNGLLNKLISASGLTKEAVDEAWLHAASLNW